MCSTVFNVGLFSARSITDIRRHWTSLLQHHTKTRTLPPHRDSEQRAQREREKKSPNQPVQWANPRTSSIVHVQRFRERIDHDSISWYNTIDSEHLSIYERSRPYIMVVCSARLISGSGLWWRADNRHTQSFTVSLARAHKHIQQYIEIDCSTKVHGRLNCAIK